MSERLKHLIKEQNKKDKRFSKWDCDNFRRIGKVRACTISINKQCNNVRCVDFVPKLPEVK